MKKLMMISISLLLVVATHGLAQGPEQPAGPSSKNLQTTIPSGPGPKPIPPSEIKEGEQPGEVFFADGTVSPDGKYLYVILDKFLYQYSLPSLEVAKRTQLGLNTGPVTPSISISKDSKHIYIISNGILYQIDGETLKILKNKKLMP
jgi:hypothetical protein